MDIIDTHCHLYVEEFKDDIGSVISSAKKVGVQRFYLPNIDSTSVENMLNLEQRYPGVCFAMMGLHPCSVKENYKEELAVVAEWLEKRCFVAVGEIGLDFYWDVTFKRQQYEAFNQQVEWAKKYNLPVVIHTREAMQEAIDVIRQHADGKLKGIFHCFGGSLREAEQIIDIGFFVGIGGVLTYRKSGLKEVLKDIPLEHLVLETDAPYLSPVPFRGKRNESAYLPYIVDELAMIKQVSPEEIARITTANAKSIFENNAV
ncbi:MAG: TatD family hydrolase [Chitinophagaceae bacterium]|nr:TatD family hydrolase [Chitinophagaceae bacterium]MCW5925600.1 TatD family hydrolase [Chitinophagaceae bacterium]